MPKCPDRFARLSSLGCSGAEAVRYSGPSVLGLPEDSRPLVKHVSSDIAFSQDLNDGAGSYQAAGSGSQEVLIPPARLALLNILWRIPLSICTAYGLTA
jgi:hypothetical protein